MNPKIRGAFAILCLCFFPQQTRSSKKKKEDWGKSGHDTKYYKPQLPGFQSTNQYSADYTFNLQPGEASIIHPNTAGNFH